MKQNIFEDGAFWIGQGDDFDGDLSVAPLLATEFDIEKKVNDRIVMYVSGLGLFEAYINGEKISDAYFEPGESHYGKRVYYQTYDITDNVNAGRNAVGLILGNGQYTNFTVNPTMEKDGELIEPHRYQKNDGGVFADGINGMKKAIVKICVQSESSENTILVSDSNWLVTDSPITFQSWYGGEDYDATREIEDWCRTGADRSSWSRAKLMKAPKGELYPKDFNSIRIVERIAPKDIWQIDNGYIIDFGKNGAGFFEMKLEGMTDKERGRKIKMLPCEELGDDGHADQRSCTQSWSERKRCEISDSYIIKGNDKETWQPRFVYHGFRYLEVTGFPYEPTKDSFTYCVLRMDNDVTGSFETDHKVLNAIAKITDRSIESNMFNEFTDCPQIEKLGWLETTHLMFHSMAFGWDIQNWIRKIVRDMVDSQEENGYVPAIAPEYHRIIGLHQDPNWGGACIMTPWYYYEFYGDSSVLQLAYEMMKKYLKHLEAYEKDGLLTNYAQMGDWGEIGERTPIILVENCAYYLLTKTVAKTAKVLENYEEAEKYFAKAEDVKTAFHNNEECYNAEKCMYGNGSQSSWGCVLFSGIVYDGNVDVAVSGLVDAVERNDFNLSSGEVGLKQVFFVLNKYGKDDVIYKMVMNDKQPSYKYFIDKGLTTLPEYWNYEEPWIGMVRSRNHAMMGHVKEWFYRGILGIRAVKADFSEVIIRPYVAEGMTHAKGEFVCGYGRIAVEWKVVSEESMSIKVSAPDAVKVHIEKEHNGGILWVKD